jgi:hypothetical protein
MTIRASARGGDPQRVIKVLDYRNNPDCDPLDISPHSFSRFGAGANLPLDLSLRCAERIGDRGPK